MLLVLNRSPDRNLITETCTELFLYEQTITALWDIYIIMAALRMMSFVIILISVYRVSFYV